MYAVSGSPESFRRAYFQNWFKQVLLKKGVLLRTLCGSKIMCFDAEAYLGTCQTFYDGALKKQLPEVFCIKGDLKNFTKFTGKNPCQSFFNKVGGLRSATLLKETLTQVYSSEFCEIFKNSFFHRTAPDSCFWL